MRYLSILLLWLASIPAAWSGEGLPGAAEQQRWEQVVTLLDESGDPNQSQADGMTALHWAAHWNQPVAASHLIDCGADVDGVNDYGVCPLSIACRLGHWNVAVSLVDGGADVNGETSGGETLLMHAARSGCVELVRMLVRRGAEVDARQSRGQTALMWAAAAGHTPVVTFLLERGADRDRQLRSGFTAFLFAVRQGHSDVVRALLEDGVDVSDRMNPQSGGERSPRKGMSGLMVAIESGHLDLALDLVRAGADPNDQRSGYAPLHALSWVRRPSRGDNPEGDPPPRISGGIGSLGFVRELVALGADVNLRLDRGTQKAAKLNPKGATPLLFATFTNDLEYARLLKELGADISIANESGTTPMLAASGVGIFVADEYPGTEEQTLAMINQLHQWGAQLDDVDNNGETVMHGAAYRSFPSVVDRLVELGATPTAWFKENDRGATPRQVAEGRRPGSFKPNKATIAAIDKALAGVGIVATDWERPVKKKKDWNQQ